MDYGILSLRLLRILDIIRYEGANTRDACPSVAVPVLQFEVPIALGPCGNDVLPPSERQTPEAIRRTLTADSGNHSLIKQARTRDQDARLYITRISELERSARMSRVECEGHSSVVWFYDSSVWAVGVPKILGAKVRKRLPMS
jgi:hypothetical protein